MGRVTGAEVKEILTTDLTNAQVETFITGANLFVTAQLGSKGLSDATLKEIERYVTAHYISNLGGRDEGVAGAIASEGAGSANRTYRTLDPARFGLLSTTPYGQTAIQLDSSKTLIKIGRKTFSIKSIDIS